MKAYTAYIQNIKLKAFTALALKCLGVIFVFLSPYFAYELRTMLYFSGLGIIFIAFLVLCNAVALVQDYTNSKTVLENLIISEFFSLIIVAFIPLLSENKNEYFVLIIAFLALIGVIVYNYLYFKELARTTKQPLFVFVFWCGLSIVLLPIALVLYFLAWAKFKEFGTQGVINKNMIGENRTQREKETLLLSVFILTIALSCTIIWLFV